ncbi:MAG: hypothetical protein JWO06_417, partial [Bacteroidota bacterium]|nr:hypothetical protein [Bacteroidota bacterium]
FKYRTHFNASNANERSINALLNQLLAGYNGGELHIHANRNTRRAA